MSFVTYVLLTGLVLGTQQRCVFRPLSSTPHSPPLPSTHTHPPSPPHTHPTSPPHSKVHSRAPWSDSQLSPGLAAGRGGDNMAVSLHPGRQLPAQVDGHHRLLRLQIRQVRPLCMCDRAASSWDPVVVLCFCSMIVCVALGLLGGSYAYYGALVYTALAIAYFLVSTYIHTCTCTLCITG